MDAREGPGMDVLASDDIFIFAGFRLHRRGGGLFRLDAQDTITPVAIGSRALDVLGALVERSGELLTRDEIIAAVWPATVVEDNNLNIQIGALRRVLDEWPTRGSCIQTVVGRGYRFTAAVARFKPGVSVNAIAAQGHARPSLSIVVLPFANLSDDREQQYFADGVTEDLTTDLSRIPDMLVISRNTAFTYRDKRIDTKQIGDELGVRFILEGSIQRSGNRVRISAKLIDAEADACLWAERFDRDASDLFALQDEITSQIAVALNLELVNAAAARPTENPDALDYILRGRALRRPARDSRAEAIRLFERALALDPHSIAAQSYLATALAARVIDNLADASAADNSRALELVEQALAVDPRSSLAHYAKGQVFRAHNQYAEAIPEYETTIELNRNSVNSYAHIGQCNLYCGSLDEVIPLVERAIRLGPRDPEVGLWYYRIGLVHLVQSRTHEAILWLEKARDLAAKHPPSRASLASAYALNGETKRAAVELAEAKRLSADDRYSSVGRLRGSGYFGVPRVRALFEANYFAGLRKAGMPEE
jgi:adenylate cyclase